MWWFIRNTDVNRIIVIEIIYVIDNIIDEIKNNKNENLILYQSNNSVEEEWNNISGFQFQIDQLESDILKENTSNAGAKSNALQSLHS